MALEKIDIENNEDLASGAKKINNAIEAADKAQNESKEALIKAIESMDLSARTQKELTEAILAGDSSPLGGQLSVGFDGTVHPGPQERLVNEMNSVRSDLAQKPNYKEVRENTFDKPINVREMDTETKKLFTGGAVAVVEEDTVGTENIKEKAVTPTETNFLELDKEVNLFDGSYLRATLTGDEHSPYIFHSSSTGRLTRIPIKPNKTYSVIREPSSRFKIATDTKESRNIDETLDGSVQIFNLGSSEVYVETFTTGPNDVVLYVDYTNTDEDVFIQVSEGVLEGFTVDDFIYKPKEMLNVITKTQVLEKLEEIIVTPKKTTFLKKVNLYDGVSYLRATLTGDGNSPYIFHSSPTGRVGKIPIKPNRTYSVNRKPSSRFKIATDVVHSRNEDETLQGSVRIQNIGSSDVYNEIFTTGPNDVVLYVDYTNTDEDVYIEVVEGYATGFVTKNYSDVQPNESLLVYSKQEIDQLLDNKGRGLTKILMIGNSFSVDATTYLFDISQSANIDIVVGVAYDSGQSLEGHWNKIQNSETITAYNKWTPSNGYSSTSDALVTNILDDEDWDIITFQQNSDNSYRYDTFQPYLTELYNYAKNKNPNARFGLHMTWARANPSSHDNSLEMFMSIVNAYQQAMNEMEFDFLIPTGTAIENGRTNSYLEAIGDRLTRDNAHLDEGIGRYIAALTVFKTLFTNEDLFNGITFYPTINNSTPFLGYLSKIAVENAVLNPFKVTEI